MDRRNFFGASVGALAGLPNLPIPAPANLIDYSELEERIIALAKEVRVPFTEQDIQDVKKDMITFLEQERFQSEEAQKYLWTKLRDYFSYEKGAKEEKMTEARLTNLRFENPES